LKEGREVARGSGVTTRDGGSASERNSVGACLHV